MIAFRAFALRRGGRLLLSGVDAALHEIIAVQGGMDAEAAAAYVKQMKKDKRYQRDVY